MYIKFWTESLKFVGIQNIANCVTNTSITWKAVLLGVVADQAAKVVMQNVVGYRGYWGCSYCEFRGNFNFICNAWLQKANNYIMAHVIFGTVFGSFREFI